MPITIDEFAERFKDVQAGLIRDYPADDEPVCHMMHHEIDLDTSVLAADADRISEAMDISIENVGLTQGHIELHEFLNAVKAEAGRLGASLDDLMCTMFIIGRRIGLADAADMGVTIPDHPPE